MTAVPEHILGAAYELADAVANPTGYADDADIAAERADFRDRLYAALVAIVTVVSPVSARKDEQS